MKSEMLAAREALLRAFPESFINRNDELIAHKRSNQYIILYDCQTPEDIQCKVLEWFSRPAHKTAPYFQEWRNRQFHKFMLDGINEFLDTKFTEEEIEIVYVKLGNSIRHDLTIKFVENGMDIEWLKTAAEVSP